MFAVQACRGTEDDQEEPPDLALNEDDSDSDEDEATQKSLDDIPIDDDLKEIKQQLEEDILKDKEDFLVLLAAREGYASWRTDSGSYLLKSLCKEIEKSTIFHDLREVMEKCRWRTYKMSGEKQVPQILSTLRARLCIKRFAKKHDKKTILVFDRIKQPWGKGDNHLIKSAHPVSVTMKEYENLTRECHNYDEFVLLDKDVELFLIRHGFRQPDMDCGKNFQ